MQHTMKWVAVAVAGLGLAAVPAGAQSERSRGDTGQREVRTGARGEPRTGRRTTPAATPERPSSAPGRAPASGVRAPAGVRSPGAGVRAPRGVRSPGAGVRSPSGVRAPGAGQREPIVDRPERPERPERPGRPHRPERPGDPDRPDRPDRPDWGHKPDKPGHGDGHCDHRPGCVCIWYPSWGWWGWGSSRYWHSFPRYGTFYGPPGRELEAPQPEVPDETEMTPLELGWAWMASGDAERAAEWYRKHLDEHPTDVEAMREYAMVLVELGRMTDAVAVLGYAYDRVPGLTAHGVSRRFWGDSPARLRRSVNDAVRYAHRASSGNAWLLVAVLMQSEGRGSVALRMVDRATDAGLSAAVGDRMRSALRP